MAEEASRSVGELSQETNDRRAISRCRSANAQAVGDLAYSSQRIADLLIELDDHAEAVTNYRRALEIREKSAAADPKDLATQLAIILVRARIGKAYAKLGNIDEARVECDKAATLLRAIPDDVTDADHLRSRVLIYSDLGDAYAVLAADKQLPSNMRSRHLRSARDMYRCSHDLMQDLRDRGILDAEEIPEIENVAHKIAECDAFLKE